MSYLTQFSRKVTVPDFLLKAPWKDISWSNDAMPSFENLQLKLKVWVDFDAAEDREYPDANDEKFTVIGGYIGAPDELITDDSEPFFFTNDEDGLQRWLLLYEAREHICAAANALNCGHLPEEDFSDDLAELSARITEQMTQIN